MELVSHTTTTVTTDKRRFKTTSPGGEVYYTTITTETHETSVQTPVPPQDAGQAPARRLKTATRSTTRRQVHRVAPYPGARPVRISARASTTLESHERVVSAEDEE